MAIKIEFKKFGEWGLTEKKLRKLDSVIKASLNYGEKKAAEMLLKVVKGHLTNQDLPWQPLADSTIWKKKGDARILIFTETYLNNIKTWKNGGTRYIGVKKGVTHPKTGEEISDIANIHEWLSYNGGPFRALWGPSLKEVGNGIGVKNIIAEVLFKKLNSLGYKPKWER